MGQAGGRGRASELSSSDARAVAAGCGSCSLWRLAAIVPPFDLRPDSACAHTRARGKAREQAKCGGYQGCVMRRRMEQTAGRPPGSADACTAQRERLRTARGDRGRSAVPLARRDPLLLHAWVRHGESLACSRASRPPGLHPLEKCDGTNNSPELSKMLKRATTGYICYFKPHVCIQSLHRRHRQHGHPRTSTRSFFAHHKQQISKAATMRHARAIIKRVAVLKQHQQSLRTGACRHILLYADLSSCGA